MDKIKVAQVGVANFGGARRGALRDSGQFDLVACYDHNEAASKACAEQDGAEIMADYDALLNYPGIEAMIISTGATTHADLTIRALEKGLHVFVEKPLCSTPEEVQDMFAAQKTSGKLVSVGHTDHTIDPYALKTKELIDSGELGSVASFEKVTAHSGGLMIKEGDWRGDPDKNPGGMLFQCGCHALHELMFYFGPVKRVSAMMRYDVHTTGTADVAICNLEFVNGVIGTLNTYHVTPYVHKLNILGTKASLYRDNRFFDEGTSLTIQREFLDGKQQPRDPVEVDGGNGKTISMNNFYDAIRNGADLYPSLIDGANAVNVVFAAEESAKTGRVVDIPELNY